MDQVKTQTFSLDTLICRPLSYILIFQKMPPTEFRAN